MNIGERVAEVKANIQRACERSGRSSDEVTLMAVTKYVEPERIAEALDAGIDLVGENHAQELTKKLTFYKQRGCGVHFIGHLQTNKIKYICGSVDLIESVDRLDALVKLNEYAQRHDVKQGILLQVNIGDETQKSGVCEDDLFALADAALSMDSVIVKGLMCVPPAVNAEQARPYFRHMKELMSVMRERFPMMELSVLSMGMSHDYETAIEEGSTLVRVGTSIFGPRPMM